MTDVKRIYCPDCNNWEPYYSLNSCAIQVGIEHAPLYKLPIYSTCRVLNKDNNCKFFKIKKERKMSKCCETMVDFFSVYFQKDAQGVYLDASGQITPINYCPFCGENVNLKVNALVEKLKGETKVKKLKNDRGDLVGVVRISYTKDRNGSKENERKDTLRYSGVGCFDQIRKFLKYVEEDILEEVDE